MTIWILERKFISLASTFNIEDEKGQGRFSGHKNKQKIESLFIYLIFVINNLTKL